MAGRWRSIQTLEYYLQEVAAQSLLATLPADSRRLIAMFAQAAPALVNSFVEAGGPEAWQVLLRGASSAAPRHSSKLQSDNLRVRQRWRSGAAC